MSNWKRWPPTDDPNTLNWQFASVEHPERIIYPDLRDGSHLVLASDYSGEHAHPEFQVLSFLLTPIGSVMGAWESARLTVRKRHLADGRRMSFKALNEALRINALPSFLEAASQLNGVLVCVAIEKTYFLLGKASLPPLQHDWVPASLEKLVQTCAFGGAVVDGLRDAGQNVHWITDDDAIVATEAAQVDAMTLMSGFLHKYPEEALQIRLGIASKFTDDERRAEDIVAIPDLAAGAFSETLTGIGKANMPTSGSGPSGTPQFLQIKATLINAWRSGAGKPLKHLDAVIRVAEGGLTRVSFGQPLVRPLRPDESADGAPTLNSKWRRGLERELKARGINPSELLKSMGIDI
jgi:hypothetical protein